jgi:sarcosine oxidase
MPVCDVAVVGLGIMGSAALAALRTRGVDAVGFDALRPGEQKGSSYGTCRIYRRFNFESPAYTSLSERAYEGWRTMEQASGEQVLLPAPLLEAGIPGSTLVRDSRAAAGTLAHVIDGAEVNARFPAFDLPADWDAVLQESAGILRADAALRLFRGRVADRIVAQNARVERSKEIAVIAADGTRYIARRLIITAGAWVADFEPRLKDYITVTRQVVGWFAPVAAEKMRYGAFPLFILETPEDLIYGFPDFDGSGAKIGSHVHGRVLAHGDDGKQDATDADLNAVRAGVARYIPAAAGPILTREVCLYTNTKGGDADGSKPEEFIVDRLPDDPRVIIASPCSGHGFKFAPAIGDILANMATDDHATAPPAFTLRRYLSFH